MFWMKPKGLYILNVRVYLYFSPYMHLPWKPVLLPLKKAAVPKIRSNNCNLQFITSRPVTERDRKMLLGIFWHKGYDYGKGSAEFSNTLQSRNLMKIRLPKMSKP